MATLCPLCGKGTLMKGEKMVYCSNYKPKKEGKDWYNEGDCEFHIPYKQAVFGRDLTPADIKRLVAGEPVKNKKGDSMILDLDSPYYTHIEWSPRAEDKEL